MGYLWTEMNGNELKCTQRKGDLGLVGYFELARFFPVAMNPTLRNHLFPKEEISKFAVVLETE